MSWKNCLRMLRHRWAAWQRPPIPADMLQRLAERVAASERQHTGQVRICVEGGLPASYLWRGATARERALTLFGKLRVWDTQANNGMLIYLLLAEHAIEIVADRGLAQAVPSGTWETILGQISGKFRQLQYEEGLMQAIDAITQQLATHFPRAIDARADNELPDNPLVI
ncbi:MAG: TPM domain-containing protein [Acidovorax sp.]|uniref:TPM domain-containing protein n=1 Tax=Acidovorax sp. TaxID=1872122 RepID=UPI0039E46BBE